MSGTLVASGLSKIGRTELAQISVPEATSTHKPVPHHTIVEALVETLSFRHIGVVQEEYAVSPDGMKMFGVLDLETQMEGCRFSIGIRNSHDKSIRLGLTAGLRVFVCSNMAFSGDFTPVTILHSHARDPNPLATEIKPRNRRLTRNISVHVLSEKQSAAMYLHQLESLQFDHDGVVMRAPAILG